MDALISDTYSDDYDITFVHILVLRQMEEDRKHLAPRLARKVAKLAEEISRPQTVLERALCRSKIASIAEQERRITSGEVEREYVARAEPLLARYRAMAPAEHSQIVFGLEGVEQVRSGATCWEKIHLIQKYLAMAGEYVRLDITRVPSQRSGCVSCGHAVDAEILTSFDRSVCDHCGAEQMQLITSKVSKDSVRTVSAGEKQDESIKNFLKAFENYQGIEAERIPDELYQALDEYFVGLNMPSGAEVRAMPLNPRGRRGNTDSRMLWYSLQETGYNAFYRHSNKIAREYWGWELPNVQHLREIIIEDYHKTQSVFHKIPLDERVRESALGTEYRLWRHLQMRGHECFMDEFRIARDPKSLRIHNANWKKMVEGVCDPAFRYIE